MPLKHEVSRSKPKKSLRSTDKLVRICLSVLLISVLVNTSFSNVIINEKNVHKQSKLDDVIQRKIEKMNEDETISVMIRLHDISIRNKMESLVVDMLRTQAEQSQEQLMSFLKDEKNARVLNRFWLANLILANVTVKTLHKLAHLDIVIKIFENFEIVVPEPLNKTRGHSGINNVGPHLPNVTWGLDRIDAPEVWLAGYKGSGIRVCVLDTGVDVSHQDLVGKMWTDNSTDPTYPGGWIEFDWSGNIIQGSTPYDSDSHGTHTSGTVLGGNESGIAIGVAPDARLMHGLVLPGGSGSFAQCISGMQWAIDPFDQYGNPVGEKAAVVSMSWGATGYHDEMIEPIENMKLAGVVPVASIGNSGEGSSGSPGNVFESLAVGAIDVFDSVAWFSSGEEIYWPASHSYRYIKPDFSAPGVDVYSSVPSSGWESWSGTSMAAPHVAGTVALMLEANNNLTVDDVYALLKIVADDLGAAAQDIRYGWGAINAYEAVNLTLFNCGVKGYIIDANTSRPLEWPAQVNVSGVEWGSQNTSNAGSYKVWLYPENYTILAGAFGYLTQNTTVEIVKDQWSTVNFTLVPKPRGIITGLVTDLADHSAMANASVNLLGTPSAPVHTNATGHYWLEAPVGVHSVDFWAWGYKPTKVKDVVVLENQTLILNAELDSTIKVAVLGDFRGQVTNLLMRNISAHERDWDLIQELPDYDVVIVNAPSDPGEQTFRDLITTANYHGVSLIFTNTYPGLGAPYGISLLQRYMGDPEGSHYAYWSGTVHYDVTVRHPIFEGWNVGDKIVLINGGDYDFAWFYGYSGMTIADIGSESLGPLGYGVGYTVQSNGSVHLLLAGLSQSSYTNIDNAWTEEAKKIFVTAVIWANEPVTVLPPSISVTPDNGLNGARVTVNGSGFAINSDVTLKFDDTPIATTRTDNNGSFIAIFNIPLAETGTHLIKAFDDHANSASIPYSVFRGTTETSLLTVEITVGSTYVRGEMAEFYVLTTINGQPVNVNRLNITIFKPDKTTETLSISQESTGLYVVSFNIPANALNGTYTLKVEAGTSGLNGTSIGSFSVSQTLTNLNAALLTIEGDLAVVQTDIGMIKMNLTQLHAEVDSVQEDVAIIETEVGEIKADLTTIKSIVENSNTSLVKITNGVALLQTEIGQLLVNLTLANADIAEVKKDTAIIRTDLGSIEVNVTYALSVIESSNKTLIDMEGNIATIETEIGEVKGIVTSIQGDLATIETDLGQIKVNLPNLNENSSPSHIPMMLITILLFAGGMVLLAFILIWSHTKGKPRINPV